MKKSKTQLTSGGSYEAGMTRAREDFAARDIKSIIKALGGGGMTLEYLGQSCKIIHPEGVIETKSRDLNDADIIIILRYLSLSDGTVPTGEWITFRDISGGIAYVSTFEERAEDRILSCFEKAPEAFLEKAKAMGGREGSLGDASFILAPFPLLLLQVVLWAGDHELPGKVKILFDKNALHHLEAEELATLGEIVAERMCS
jgi:hypothetical protein